MVEQHMHLQNSLSAAKSLKKLKMQNLWGQPSPSCLTGHQVLFLYLRGILRGPVIRAISMHQVTRRPVSKLVDILSFM